MKIDTRNLSPIYNNGIIFFIYRLSFLTNGQFMDSDTSWCETCEEANFLCLNHLLLFYSGIGTIKKRHLTKLFLFVDYLEALSRITGFNEGDFLEKNTFPHTFSNKFCIFEQFDEKQLKNDRSYSTKERNHYRNDYRWQAIPSIKIDWNRYSRYSAREHGPVQSLSWQCCLFKVIPIKSRFACIRFMTSNTFTALTQRYTCCFKVLLQESQGIGMQSRLDLVHNLCKIF